MAPAVALIVRLDSYSWHERHPQAYLRTLVSITLVDLDHLSRIVAIPAVRGQGHAGAAEFPRSESDGAAMPTAS